MAKRPGYTPDQPLTPEQLLALRRKFEMLSVPNLVQAYGEALDHCRLDRNGRVPQAQYVQKLVQVWKALRRNRLIHYRDWNKHPR